MRRRLEVGQDVDEEAIGVGVAGVGLLGRLVLGVMLFLLAPATMVVVLLWLALSVVEDDDLVDAEDGEGSSDLSG